MRVTYIWPNYDGSHDGLAPGAAIDAFWVECSPAEAENKVLRLATPVSQPDQRRIDAWRARGHTDYCFLVTRDLRAILHFWWSYPFDNLWNAYSPFLPIKPVEIEDLHQLRTLNVEYLSQSDSSSA